MSDLTPLMKQYREIKQRHPDAILFFQVGDFYEMFHEDAQVASKILNITLTTRDRQSENPVPLCGVPVAAAVPYLSKLIAAGKTVAVCDQLEDPRLVKGLVKRDVVRVITPGTVLEESLLAPKENLFVASIFIQQDRIALAAADLSTGEVRLLEAGRLDAEAEIPRLNPTEVVCSAAQREPVEAILRAAGLPDGRNPILTVRSADEFLPATAEKRISAQYADRFPSPITDRPTASAALGALLGYLDETQRVPLRHLKAPLWIQAEERMALDGTAQRTLELVQRALPSGTTAGGSHDGTLLGVLDFTLTPMGGRWLRRWLLSPLTRVEAIEERLDAVEELASGGGGTERRYRLRQSLEPIGDLERLTARITLGLANGRDLLRLADSVGALPAVEKTLIGCSSRRLRRLGEGWDSLEDLKQLIGSSIRSDAPAGLREGGIVQEGYHAELDELRRLRENSRSLILEIERRERQRTRIESLKVRYNQVFGYYIEVTRPNLDRVPTDYIRKQTMANAERFITQELKELETRILGAEERMRILEYELFEQIRMRAAAEARRVQAMAERVAHLDVLASLAETADRHRYVRPRLQDQPMLRIAEGRHPVIECLLPGGRFVPNDTTLGHQDCRLLILTGPNMAGKSTYMRQVALIVILAQMGSFVPAKEAEIGIVDRVFTRVGAWDNLVEGQSTFMVEMQETADILKQATPRSLILLDEIGRGTSTFDGISIAWAVAEHLHRLDGRGARTLFATHYHELTELALIYEGVKNYNVAVREWSDQIIFLHKIAEGGADKSYGIQVARLAGLPQEVIRRAKEILANLEGNALNETGQPRLAAASEGDAPYTLFRSGSFETDPLLREIAELDPNRMTPLEALTKLSDLSSKARTASGLNETPSIKNETQKKHRS